MAKKKKVAKKKVKSNVSIEALVVGLQMPVVDLVEDAAKFDRGNATAGVRVRVGLMGVVNQIKTIRTDILTQKKMRENKKRRSVDEKG